MFTLDDDILRQLRATFKDEAAEHIQAMNRILLALEKKPQGDERTRLLEEIFREAHSLKGAAGAADLKEVEATGHRLESVLGALRSGQIELSPELCDLLYESLDAVALVIEAALEERAHDVDLPSLHARLEAAAEGRIVAPRAKASAPPAPLEEPEMTALKASLRCESEEEGTLATVSPAQRVAREAEVSPAEAVAKNDRQATPKRAAKPEEAKAKSRAAEASADETIRVATSKLDALMTQAGELLVAGLKIDQRLQEVEQISHALEDWNREWLKIRATYSGLIHNAKEEMRPLIKFLDANQQWLKTLVMEVNNLKRGFASDALHLSRVTNDLGEGVMRVRMLPLSTLFDAFPRLVRDVARERGKEVDLKIEGGDTELDRKVLEEIKDPLIHLLRNSVDHGIEPPEQRVAAGKPARGTITISAFQKGNNIVIEVSDDGAGIDVAKVKQAAIKSGAITVEEAQTMSDEEAMRLIFLSGLSTSDTITDISGRGVGMDVVRKNVEALQGQVDVDSTPGQGTKVTLTLPLTLATTLELLVQVEGQTYGLPISAVERILRINTSDIASVEGREAIAVEGEPISLVRLADVLELTSAEKAQSQENKADQKIPVVIVSSGKKRIAFVVDAVVGQQESVVKSLGKQLARVRNVAGATILGTGQVIMTLNPTDLVASARMAEGRIARPLKASPAKAEEQRKPTILVVDDSLTTRTLEKNILETAGYEVKVANDGVEALSILQTNDCSLVVSDVLMPRMTGLELTAAIKGNPKTKHIPVVLVTSLESREDRERGVEVGADAYIVKSNFDQANLLQTIEQLL